MNVTSVLFGRINIPDNEPEIIVELDNARKRIIYRYSRYEQNKIDYLEDALDKFRRSKEDV